MNRRELIQKMIIGGTTLVIVPSILESCTKDSTTDPGTGGNNPPPSGSKITIDLTSATYSALNTVGGYKVVQAIIVANTGNNTFVAVDSACTHNGCGVEYNNTSANFVCPCHGSVFSKTGSVVNGPATTALKSYQISRTGDILTITIP